MMTSGKPRAVLLCVLIALAAASLPARADVPEGKYVLWYKKPAGLFTETLLLGNGHIGASVYGMVPVDRISLNHTRIWRKDKYRSRHVKDVAGNLPAVRKALLAGEIKGGTLMIWRGKLGSMAGGVDSYQPAGDVYIALAGHNKVSHYRRELDLATGIAKVTYRSGGVTYTREHFCSNRDGVLVIRLTADRPGSITCTLRLSRQRDKGCEIVPWARGERCGFDGRFVEDLRFAAAMTAVTRGGKVTTKTGRRVGLGVPLFAQAAREADGDLRVKSEPGGGTRIVATFRHGHPDRKPLGDLRETMAVLVCAHPDVEFVCEHVRNGRMVYRIDTRFKRPDSNGPA